MAAHKSYAKYNFVARLRYNYDNNVTMAIFNLMTKKKVNWAVR